MVSLSTGSPPLLPVLPTSPWDPKTAGRRGKEKKKKNRGRSQTQQPEEGRKNLTGREMEINSRDTDWEGGRGN